MSIEFQSGVASGEYITVPVSESAYPFSMSIWVKCPTDLPTSSARVIVMNLRESASYGIEVRVWEGTTTNDVDVHFYIDGDGGGTRIREDADTGTQDTWINFILVVRAANDQELYTNGTSVTTNTISRDMLGGTPPITPAQIGGRASYAPHAGMKFAYYAFWSSEITGTNITDLQTKTPDNISNTPDNYVPFDTGTLTATIGGNASEVGTDVYQAAASDNPSLTGPGTSQTAALFNKIRSGYGPLEGAGMNGRLQR